MSGRWVDLREAAELLNTSTEAVRKRAARGSLESSRENGRVLVWVDEGRTEGGHDAHEDHHALLEAKDETIRILQEQLQVQLEQANERDRENRRIIAMLTSRVPELEASRESPVSSEPRPGRPGTRDAGGGPQEDAEHVSWWRRVFGG